MIEKEKTFIVGDVHGCLDMLKRLMEAIGWSPDTDRLIFLGDFIDRGTQSRGVVEYVMEISNRSERVECLMGNHERILLDFLDGKDTNTFFLNGGMATLNSYRTEQQKYGGFLIPEDHVSFLRSLKLLIELEDYYVVHAGFRPGIPIANQTTEDLLWIRDSFIFSNYYFGKRVIFGHTPFAQPLVMENKIGLDTGAVYGNRLTCLELPSCKFHFVEA
ncbi:MAG: metallophosphoesterase [Desulfobacterota bacterium]|jgi:serine/threonine protein phosphatase 1|nr:metallophosphoesterase [Thermodesulfobacteriota bacterium]